MRRTVPALLLLALALPARAEPPSLCEARAKWNSAKGFAPMPLYLFPVVEDTGVGNFVDFRRELVLGEGSQVFQAAFPFQAFITHLGKSPIPSSLISSAADRAYDQALVGSAQKHDLKPEQVLSLLGEFDRQQLLCAEYFFVPVMEKYITDAEQKSVNMILRLQIYRVHKDRLEDVQWVKAEVPSAGDAFSWLFNTTRGMWLEKLNGAVGGLADPKDALAALDHITTDPAALVDCAATIGTSAATGEVTGTADAAKALGKCAPKGTNDQAASAEETNVGKVSIFLPDLAGGGRASYARSMLEYQRCVAVKEGQADPYACSVRTIMAELARRAQNEVRALDEFRMFSPARAAGGSLRMTLGKADDVELNDRYLILRGKAGSDERVGVARVRRVGTGKASGADAESELVVAYGDETAITAEPSQYRLVEDHRTGIALEAGGGLVAVMNREAFFPPTASGTRRGTSARFTAPAASIGLHTDGSSLVGLRDFWETNSVDWAFTQDLRVIQLQLGAEKRFLVLPRTSLVVGAKGSVALVWAPSGTLTADKKSEAVASAAAIGGVGVGGIHLALSPGTYLELRGEWRQYSEDITELKHEESNEPLALPEDFFVRVSGPTALLSLGYEL